MEAARFERNVRTESSEIFTIYGGARRVGRVDIHYGRFEVHGTLLLEVDLTDDELQQVIDQIDEELVQTHDPEREDFLVTVFKSEELGFYSDEFEADDAADDDEELIEADICVQERLAGFDFSCSPVYDHARLLRWSEGWKHLIRHDSRYRRCRFSVTHLFSLTTTC